MKKKHTPEEIVKKLQHADGLRAEGMTLAAVARELGISLATLANWRKKYRGMDVSQAQKLKALEKENARLHRTVSNLVLDNQILKEAAEGNW